MEAFEIVTAETSIRVTFRPHIPGVRIRISGLAGGFRARRDGDGAILFHEGVEGEFRVKVDELDVGNRLFTKVAKAWLAGSTELGIHGTVTEVVGVGADGFRAAMRTFIKGSYFELTATGTMKTKSDGRVHVDGATVLHPRDIGVPVPRKLAPMVHNIWSIVLEPRPDGSLP